MMLRRPSPEKIAALKFEIERRYKNQAAKSRQRNRSRGMAAIRLAELTRWFDDSYGKGVELEPGEASYRIVRIFAHHLGSLPDAPRRITSWVTIYAPWISLRDRERLISEVVACPLKWSADKLAWKIRMADEQRTRLKITTIGAIDCSKEQRAERRKQAKAQRERNRRAAKRQVRVPTI